MILGLETDQEDKILVLWEHKILSVFLSKQNLSFKSRDSLMDKVLLRKDNDTIFFMTEYMNCC